MLVPTMTLWQLSFSPVQFTADETQSHKSLGSDAWSNKKSIDLFWAKFYLQPRRETQFYDPMQIFKKVMT